MKTRSCFPVVLFILLLHTFAAHSFSQVIRVNQTFSSDTIFAPFTGPTTVYSLKAFGNVNLYSDSSLVRIVMVDSYGNHWLVFESYPLITDTSSFVFSAGCDETCFLDGIVPDSIRIDLISAFLTLDSLKLDTNYISNVTELQAQAKWNNDSVKIAIMNRRIVEEKMYWRAGKTDISGSYFYDKEREFSKKFNLEGYDFYKGGIYQKSSDRYYQLANSEIINDFDWRKRHDANLDDSPYFDGDPPGTERTGWLTKLKYQEYCSSCYAFSAVGTVEAYVNLFFNNNIGNPLAQINSNIKHQIDVDLSELEVIRCQLPVDGHHCYSLGDNYYSLRYIQENGVRNEECLNYELLTGVPPSPPPPPPPSCFSKCSDSQATEIIQTNGRSTLGAINEISVKTHLINHGPLACYLSNFPYNGVDHCMVLVGYTTAKAGDTVYQGTSIEDPPIVLDNSCNFLQSIEWIFKDSRNSSVFFQTNNISINQFNPYDCYFLYNSVLRQKHTTPILCTDEDGDGYYWWGIHRDDSGNQIDPQLCNCPTGVIDEEEDCNDNDVSVGPYNTGQNSQLPLYECLPNNENCVTSQEPIVIDENYQGSATWTEDVHIHQNIIIRSDFQLTISCNVFFSPDAGIFVEPNGVLTLQGNDDFNARLSSGCNQFWKGVELWGNPLSPQSPIYQGKIIIDRGTIENAEVGIKTANSVYVPDGGGGDTLKYAFPTGGIIEAKEAEFRNNVIGVEFYPYRKFDTEFHPIPNTSFFHGCTFVTDTELLEEETPKYLLKLDGVNNIDIKGCTFKNINYSEEAVSDYDLRGIGIYSNNSCITIDDITFSGRFFPARFEKLSRGIHGTCSGFGPANADISNCEFAGNRTGIYLSAYNEVTPVSIEKNSFTFQFDCDETDTIKGLYLDRCSGYKVTQNSFDGTYFPGSDLLVGIAINNSGVKTNYIYNNYPFKNLTCGILGQNVNRGYYTPDFGGLSQWPVETGLRFVCNDFDECISDIVINRTEFNSSNGVTFYQRNIENPSVQTQKPAGNSFSLLPSGTKHVFDINIDGSEDVGNIQYKYHTSPANGPTIRLFPDHISNQDKVTYDPFYTHDYVKDVSCTTNFYPSWQYPDIRSTIALTDQKIDSLVTLLQLLTDNGSTDTLRNIVENSTPPQSYDIYQDLMNASPYLSDTVLQESIQREEVLTNPMIRDIMVANPQSAKSDDLLNTLDNRINPMPDSLWAEIIQGQDTIGAMERLKSELSGWIQKRDIFYNSLIELFLTDSVYSCDSITDLLQNDFNLISRYNLIIYYLNRSDFTQANNVLQNIPNEFPLRAEDEVICQDFSVLIPILEQLSNDTFGYIAPDSIQIISLLSLAERDYSIPGVFARNILVANDLLDFFEPIQMETSLKSARWYRHYGKNIKISSELKVYPNPCKDYLVVEYQKERQRDIAICSLINSSGTILFTYSLQKTSNQVIISIANCPPGSYLIQLKVNGITKGFSRIIKIY